MTAQMVRREQCVTPRTWRPVLRYLDASERELAQVRGGCAYYGVIGDCLNKRGWL